MSAFLKPIFFYGKVVDQMGMPVAEAHVTYSANDNPDWGPMAKSGTKGTTLSADDGTFAIQARGIGIYVEVSKDGYDRISTSPTKQTLGSYSGFSNSEPLGNSDLPIPASDRPAILTLRKRGEADPLVNWGNSMKVPKNGTPVEVSLENGHVVPSDQGDLRIECWTEDHKKDAQGNYPWRCRVSVPGGGLVKREDDYAFEAPNEGYQSHDDIEPPEDRWSAKAERSYFVKMADGHFARVNLRMRTGGAHFAVIEAYFNPRPGSRNLEFDPAKQAPVR